MFYTPEAGDLNRHVPARALALEICEVDRARASWTEVCVVQFLSVRATDGRLAIKASPQIPLLAGVGAHRCRTSAMRPMRHVDPDGALTQ